MKTIRQTIIWTIIIFIGLTLLTMKEEAPVDGINSYGFPLTFYNYFSGKCNNCYNQYGFKFFSLLTDLCLIALIAFLGVQLKRKVFFRGLFVLILFGWVSCSNETKPVKCDNVVCDTINNYSLKQICNDTTIEYDLTYTDTAKLLRHDGELIFSIHQCGRCEGTESVDILSDDRKVVETVKVDYHGGGKSERISTENLIKFINTVVKVNWTDHGKVFYITRN